MLIALEEPLPETASERAATKAATPILVEPGPCLIWAAPFSPWSSAVPTRWRSSTGRALLIGIPEALATRASAQKGI